MRLRAGRLARGLVSAVVVMAGLALLSGDALAAPPAIAPASLPGGQVGVAYSQTLSASGSTAPYTWTVSAGSLPAGLTLSTAGVISGSPATPGTANFTIQAASSAPIETNTKAYSIVVSPAAVSVTTASLPSGVVGMAYNQSVAATGGTPPYTWAISAGALPAGLALNASTGAISGTPSAAATANFTVRATDATAQTATRPLSITIAPTSPLAVATTSLVAGTMGVAYSQTLAATGGTAPYTWAITAGALPAGLALNPSTGAIGGTPSAAGIATFTVRATDAVAATATQALSITVSAASALVVNTSALPDALLNDSYGTSISASGGTPPYTWILAGGSLPPGIGLDASGVISGTPVVSGSFSFTVLVTDAASTAAQGTFVINVSDASTSVNILTTSLSSGTVGSSYSASISVSGGTLPYTWTVNSGSLPSGLSLDSSSGIIAGTPSAIGDFSFTVSVNDVVGVTASMSYTITITGQGLTIADLALPAASPGASYRATFSVSGGTSPYSWFVASGTLPDGLALDSGSGTISGTVGGNASGTATFTVGVTDTNGLTATRDLSIQVVAAGFVGAAPVRGSIGLLVVRGGATASSLSTALSTAGCTVESLALLENGRWLMYVAGAPAVVNVAFPASLADMTPFFVRCRQ